MKLGRGVRVIASVVALAGMATFAEDLAWTFDTSGRTDDVVMASAPAQNSASVVVPTNVGAESATIGFFDSRWSYGFLVDGFTYVVKSGFLVIFK
jgi:hypothetical protein